jgi:FlxA-like protein
MTRIDRSCTWWMVVVVVGLMISQTQTATGAGTRTSLESLQLQVDMLTRQLTALQQQVTQDNSALQQQIDQLQQQIDVLNDQLTALEQAANGPAVYDANGKQVGPIVSILTSGGPVVVAFRVGEHVMPLFVKRVGIGADETGTQNNLYFETTNCTGTPFALAQSSTILPRAIVAEPGSTVYFVDPFGPSHLITQRSFLPGAGVGGQPGPCSAEAGPTVMTVVPVLPLLDLDTMFTPPFSVR